MVWHYSVFPPSLGFRVGARIPSLAVLTRMPRYLRSLDILCLANLPPKNLWYLVCMYIHTAKHRELFSVPVDEVEKTGTSGNSRAQGTRPGQTLPFLGFDAYVSELVSHPGTSNPVVHVTGGGCRPVGLA
jgi:hypothetical protein